MTSKSKTEKTRGMVRGKHNQAMKKKKPPGREMPLPQQTKAGREAA